MQGGATLANEDQLKKVYLFHLKLDSYFDYISKSNRLYMLLITIILIHQINYFAVIKYIIINTNKCRNKDYLEACLRKVTELPIIIHCSYTTLS